jgi:hypothetical protein
MTFTGLWGLLILHFTSTSPNLTFTLCWGATWSSGAVDPRLLPRRAGRGLFPTPWEVGAVLEGNERHERGEAACARGNLGGRRARAAH